MLTPLQRTPVAQPTRPMTLSTPPKLKEETIKAPSDSIFVNFTKVTEEPARPVPGKPAVAPKVVRQEVELKNGLSFVEDKQHGLVEVRQRGAGGAPTVLAQFEGALELPGPGHEGIRLHNRDLSQAIGLDGKMVIKDTAEKAHLVADKIPEGYTANRWIADTYVVDGKGQSYGLQAQYQMPKGALLPRRSPRANPHFETPVSTQGRYVPVAVREKDGQLEVSLPGTWHKKHLGLFVSPQQVLG